MKAEEITWRYIVSYFAALLFFYELFMILPSTWIELLTARLSADALNILGLNSDYGITGTWVWLTRRVDAVE